jgi:hypothetical protein
MAEKLDAKFYGEIRKVKDDSIVPDDEYIVFLAKDNCVPAMLDYYYHRCSIEGADKEQLEAVIRMIDRVRAWRLVNAHRCKVPDAAGEKLLG